MTAPAGNRSFSERIQRPRLPLKEPSGAFRRCSATPAANKRNAYHSRPTNTRRSDLAARDLSCDAIVIALEAQ
jgi:hypothetical protein